MIKYVNDYTNVVCAFSTIKLDEVLKVNQQTAFVYYVLCGHLNCAVTYYINKNNTTPENWLTILIAGDYMEMFNVQFILKTYLRNSIK